MQPYTTQTYTVVYKGRVCRRYLWCTHVCMHTLFSTGRISLRVKLHTQSVRNHIIGCVLHILLTIVQEWQDYCTYRINTLMLGRIAHITCNGLEYNIMCWLFGLIVLLLQLQFATVGSLDTEKKIFKPDEHCKTLLILNFSKFAI